MEGVARKRQKNGGLPIGYAYVVIPKNVEREDYIKTVFRKERITVLGEGNLGIFKECPISKLSLQQISFPADSDTTGSLVCYVTEPFNNKPTIIAVISKERESQLLEEGEFSHKKEYDDNIVEVNGSAKETTLNLNVTGINDDGVININVVGKTSGKININAQTEIKLVCNDILNIESFGETNLKATNEESKSTTSVSVSKDGLVTINGENISMLKGNDFAVRYSSTSDSFTDIQDKYNDLAQKWNSFVAAYIPGGPASVGEPLTLIGSEASQSTSDISLAKIEEIKVP